MKKEALDLRPRVKLLYNNNVEYTDLKRLFDYTSDYNLLSDILELFLYDLSNLTVRSHHGNYRYMELLIPCIKKLIYYEDIIETSPVYYKIQKVISKIEEELTKKHNRNMNNLLNKIKDEFVDILTILNSVEYIERHRIEAENIEKMNIRKAQAIEITKYILFEIRDIRLIMGIKNEYFHSAIKEDMENIIKRLCYEYTSGNLAFDEYYYLLFIYLSTDSDFEIAKCYDYILNTFKNYIKSDSTKITNDNVDSMTSILNKINMNDTKAKYDIPSPMNDVDIDFNINKNDRILDLRDLYTFTIDPPNAECLDDALSYEKLSNGNFLISVYIADLSDIVLPTDGIDSYAYNIAETIYRGKNIPMLPDIIYNKYSSLIVGADKLVHAYTFEINPDYIIVDVRVDKAIIRVRDNYTYGKIDDLILHSNMPFADDLRNLYDYSMYLLKNNVRRQKYMYSKEVLDPSRKLVDRFGNNPSNRIISELKVLVNSYLALNAYNMDIPFIYRNNLKNQKIDNPDFIKLFTDPEFSYIKYVLYSSFGSSYYSARNEGHYGLDLGAYAHVSTPLRNYSSLFNQRMISNYMLDEDIVNADSDLLKTLCNDLSVYLNKRIILNKMYTSELSNKKKILTK